MARTDELSGQLDRLTDFNAGPYPVISLYLNLQADDRGRDRYDVFLRSALPARIRTYPAEGPERRSLERDQTLIANFLATLEPSVNGLALFACAGAGLFETVPLAAPVPDHGLIISDQPHLYPLARIIDAYPRYAVLVADTHAARLVVVAANAVERTQRVESTKTKRHKMGGWSQARFQRHVDHFREQHAREVVNVLTRIVRDEQIPSVIIGGDEVIVPMLKSELPKDVAERVVDVLRLDIRSPEQVILERSLEVIRRQDGEDDRERVAALLDAYRGNGLAVVGVDDTRRAFDMGQVDELVLTAAADGIESKDAASAPGDAGTGASRAGRTPGEHTADALIVMARHTGAAIRFIEDPALLREAGGVGAFLRFQV